MIPPRSVITVVVCILALSIMVVFVFILWPFPAQPPSPGNTLLEATPVLGSDKVGSTSLPSPAAPSPTAEPRAHPLAQDTEANGDIPSGPLFIRVQDALGDPIASGQVSIGKKQFAFDNGLLLVPALETGTHVIVASAARYASATQVVEIPTVGDTTFCLEYLCCLDFVVYSSRKERLPAEGAQVTVWQGLPVRRPVTDAVALRAYLPGGQSAVVRLHRDEDGIQVVAVDSYEEPPPGRFDVEPGDSIIALGGMMWRRDDESKFDTRSAYLPLVDPVSPRLRLWDAMVAYSESESMPVPDDSVAVERETSRQVFDVGKMDTSQRGRVVASKTTDSSGRCRFENLPAGTYFAQARWENLRSQIAVVHPARRGAKLYLEGSGMLHVDVKYSEVSVLDAGGIANALVYVKSVDHVPEPARFVGRTDRFGSIAFESVPWGRYELSVTPPRELFLGAKRMRLAIEEPAQFLTIEFAPKYHSVFGKVLNAETRDPVAGITLEMWRTDSMLAAARKATSAADGSFVFANLRAGVYDIRYRPRHVRDYKGFLPAGWKNEADNGYSSVLEVKIEDKDIHNVEYLVLPAVQTRFTGKVISAEGTAVAGAKLSLIPLDKKRLRYLVESEALTGDDGRFDLCIVTPRDGQIHVGEIEASLLGPRPGETDRGREFFLDVGGGLRRSVKMTWPLGPKHRRITHLGSCPVEFRIGDRISNILITMKGVDDAPAVAGKIITEDGDWPIPLAVSVWHKTLRRRLYGELTWDGSYRVDWVPPGPFVLTVENAESLMARVDEEFGWRPNWPVCNYSLELHMPPDQKTLNVDVRLQRAGHLAGRIVDLAGQPVPGVKVLVSGTERYPGEQVSTISDEEGLFWVYGLRVGREHTIEAIPESASQPAVVLQGLTPPDQNIVVRLNPLSGMPD